MADLANLVTDRRLRSRLPVSLPNRPMRGKQTVVTLVAYEELMVRNVLIMLLQDEGYFVLTASDGQEALTLSRMYPGTIDLVITDVRMPRLTCTDLCSLLLRERPGIKVLVMTGTDKTETAVSKVTSLFLPRPFDGEMVKEQVRKILAAPVQWAPYVYMAFLGRPTLDGTDPLASISKSKGARRITPARHPAPSRTAMVRGRQVGARGHVPLRFADKS